MGAQASRDAGAVAADVEGPSDGQEERLMMRAWRSGVPFTLLHDEGFVVEKYQEMLAASDTQKASTLLPKTLEEAQTTVSGLDEAPMDEIQHAADKARVKLFARTKRDESAGWSGSRPASPSATEATSTTLTSSSSKENPPSALAGMVGNTLSRESPESVENEKIRAQRDELLRVYFEQIASRMKLNQVETEEEMTVDYDASTVRPGDGGPVSRGGTTRDGPIGGGERRQISEGVTVAGIFSVGSLRMQLEMLREFRVFSPRLFENGTMALVQTLLDSPPFALQDVVAGSPEDSLLRDIHRFCRDILRAKDTTQLPSQLQRQIVLLLLLSIGVSSGRISVLLEFVDELLRLPHEVATSETLVQGYTFVAWVNVFVQRMQSYRIDYALGTFEDRSFAKKVSVKTLPGEADTKPTDESDSASQSANLISSPLATDGSFAYTWSLRNGLAKIGTGLNFTIAGRVYAEVPASMYVQAIQEKRVLRKLVYGFGEDVKDVSEICKAKLASLSTDSATNTVIDVFGGYDDQVPSTTSKLLISYRVGKTQDVCVLGTEDIFALPVHCTDNGLSSAIISRAWYGTFDVLNTEALLEFQKQLKETQDAGTATDELGIMLTRQLLEQLLALSGISLETIVNLKKLMVVFSCGEDSNLIGAEVLDEGDRFADVENRSRDTFYSSLVYCGDSLYLALMYPEIDTSGLLIDVTSRRCHQLLRISPQDLSLLEVLSLESSQAFINTTSAGSGAIPFYAYATEGRLIYEISVEVGEIYVNVITPKTTQGGKKDLVLTRRFALHEKSILCSQFVHFLETLRSTTSIQNDKLELVLPSFYTNGASLGILFADVNVPENVLSNNCVHCVLFDCETGHSKGSHENGESKVCLEFSLQHMSACFDARNNLLWLYDEDKRVLRSYHNSGKRIPMDDNAIPSDFITRMIVSKSESGDKTSFLEATAFSLLTFLYKYAVASDSAGGLAGGENFVQARIPFAIDVDVNTFQLLLAFTSKYVDVFKANEASIVQLYILQACVGILNKNLERLLLLSSCKHTHESLGILKEGLSSPLDKLLEFSTENVESQSLENGCEEMSQIPVSSKIDERSRLQVASVALDLYTTSIRVFHSDVSKQFTHVLKYLQLWQQSRATKMELKILARLLSHLCARVNVIYSSMLASDDALRQFLELVEFAAAVQQRQLRHVFTDEVIPTQYFEHSKESSLEVVSLVNAITQIVFVAFAFAGDERSRRSFDVALVVFNTMRDACSSICSDLADLVKHQDCQSQWVEMEKVLKEGFIGILAPMILSSGVALLRNRESIKALISLNDESGSSSAGTKQSLMDASSALCTTSPGCSLLVEFLKENSSKLLKLMISLNTLVSMIDPSKREHTVENVSMALKTETMESSHEYENNMDALTELQVPGATRMVITFDPKSRTEVNYDYVTFYKDKSQGEYYGSQFYSGRDSEQNWPGVGDNPPLIIENDHCFVYFHTDGSNTDWGYKFTATAEILERKKSVQQHWIVFLLESVVQVLDESIKLLVDGSAFSPIEDMEVLNEQYLQSDLLRSGVCPEDSKNAEVLQLLQDFVDPPESSEAEKLIQALQARLGTIRPGMALARSTSFDQITSSAPNKYVNSAVRAVAAAIFHHNMWGMDAYAFSQNLRDDISDQLLRGWKNAQKMRDWFHLGDAADAGIHGQMLPNRRRSGRLRRQPSAYKGLSEESLAILCDNVIKRASFLLEITPVSFAYVTGAKRRWGLLAKYGHAIGKQISSDTQLDKWYNLLDELQAATELRSLFQYRRSSSERLKQGQVKSVTEQVLEFIQSDVDVSELRKLIEIRNRRACSRALGIEIFIQSLKDCQSLRLKGIMLESFASTLKSFTIANSVSGSPSISSLDPFPRLHYDTLLLGCDESLRQRIAEAFGSCLTLFGKQLASISDYGTCSGFITGILKCCAIDYDLEDSYLLQESRVLQQILRLLSSNSVPTRNAAQSLLGVLLSRFIAGRVESSPQEDEDDRASTDAHDVSAFQRQLFAAVGHQLEGIVSVIQSTPNPRSDIDFDEPFPRFLPENSPGFTAPCLQRNIVGWNHSIMLWVYSPSKGPLYALKVGDEVRRGPSSIDIDENTEAEIGTVIGIPSPTTVHVRWSSSGLTTQCEFNPKRGIFDIVLVDEGVGGTIFFKGNKSMIKDSAAAKPWSHFGLFLTDKRMLVYKVACGSDKESVFETDCELDADQWSHVAIVQDEDTLRVYVNGSMASQHLLESFLVMNGNVNPAESAIIESAHPLEDSIDEYCPVHIPGAVKIRLTFDPLCDIDGSTGFVRFYKDAKCVEYWGEDKYTGRYSDPERNFPGAQSNRARSLQHANEADNVDMNILEIPSDRLLVYFHNDGSANSWGFRILASPEFAASEGDLINSVSHLNPYPFYFGETPSRVLDHPAAKCWIYLPKVLSYPISESDLTEEIQTSYPSSDIISKSVPAETMLHTMGLIQACAETSFGRSLIGTPENLRNLIFLSFDDRVPVEVQTGGIGVLKDLISVVGPNLMDLQLTQALPREADDFLSFVFKRLARALNVWHSYEDDNQAITPVSENEDNGSASMGSILHLRTSAQGETSLVAAYVSLLRKMARYSCWSDRVFGFVISGLQASQDWNKHNSDHSEHVVGPILASLAILGGSYSGVYIGGRVSCCVNVDGKEMIETGYLVQFRMKGGVQIARVIFDCDQSSTVDVPLTDVAHLDDIEMEELSCFLKGMEPFASELKDLYNWVLDLTPGMSSHEDESYQPKLTKKENVEVLESEHPYAGGEDVTYPLKFRGASEIVVRFDKLSCTAGPNDYIQFKKREEDVKESGNEAKYWGEEKYYGESFPGVGSTPPLRIPTGCVDVHFYTESTSSSNSEWGFKLTAHAFEEALIYPPEIPPPILVSARHDIRARCIKSLGRILQSGKHAEIIPTFASLLPSLAKIANDPFDGRPIQSSPKSQIFESKHPYANSVMEYMKVTFSGASTLTITFDPQSRTEHGCDYLCFFKDKSLTERWGAYQYCGVSSDANWPGLDERPPLVIPSDSFTLLWTTDGSNVDWGWKFNVTAEFKPEFPLDKNLKQLDARCYRLFETLYEKMNHQRVPLKSEFEEFTRNGVSCEHNNTRDPTRPLLVACCSKEAPGETEWGSTAARKVQRFRVTDESGVKIYSEKDRESNVLVELDTATEFIAENRSRGWLKVIPDSTSELAEEKAGWVWQRTGDVLHVTALAFYAGGEDLLTLGVDDINLESKHSILQMDESNSEEKSLASLCSPFSFDECKGQTDRIQSLAYDSHRAMTIQAARDAILNFLSCDPTRTPVLLNAFGDAQSILLLLSHFFSESIFGAAFDSQSRVLIALRKRLKHMVVCGSSDALLSKLIVQCISILNCGPNLLPKGRGAVRVLESTHPYQDNSDQYWDISIPGATRIKVIFDRRCKSEAGCDWVRIYKTGSNRTETIGPDQIGGRGDNENWPGTGDRSPLYIDSDSFEVYFHSDSSNNDWGFKLYAIGIFTDEEPRPQVGIKESSNSETVVRLLYVASWILDTITSTPDVDLQASSTAFRTLYSGDTLHTLMKTLNEAPQCIKTCALQVLSNMSQSAGFYTIPAILIERVRNLMNVKMRAKYQAEDRVELKSPYLQALVQCAVAVDLSIDSHCFEESTSSDALGAHISLPYELGDDGTSIFVSESGVSSSGRYQFRLVLNRLVSALTISLKNGVSPKDTAPFLQWEHSGNVSFWRSSDDHKLVEMSDYDFRVCEGDTIIIQLDVLHQTLVFRKNSVVVALIAGPAGSGALIPWNELYPARNREDDIRLVVSQSSPENRIEFSSLSCSAVALIPQSVVPKWYRKIVDAVGMMLDFQSQIPRAIVRRESRHPLISSTKLSKPTRDHVDIDGAVALEIRFDQRTKFQKNDELRFFYASHSKKSGADREEPALILSGISGDDNEKECPNLFAARTIPVSDNSLSIGDLVVRSLDWEYSDEDGGGGSIGIVQAITAWGAHGGKGVRVRWQHNGFENVYRYGINGRYDVQNLEMTKYRNAPVIIPGSKFSYEFLPGTPHKTANLDLSSTPEFAGSLELNGSSLLDINIVEENERVFSESDFSLEFWACISKHLQKHQSDSGTCMEVFRMHSSHSRVILLSNSRGKWVLEFQRVNENGTVVETRPCYESTISDSSNSSTLVPGEWAHLALVFSGTKAVVIKNGDVVYSARLLEHDRSTLGSKPSLTFGNSSHEVAWTDSQGKSMVQCIGFHGYLYDIRIWDVAFRVEQLRSHFRGLDTVEVASRCNSRSGTPTSGILNPLSPMRYLSSPRSPRSSMSTGAAVPMHVRKWITTNRTSREISTVRLNCYVKLSSLTDEDANTNFVVYYEAHALSNGKMCVGWILDGTTISGRSTMIGEECNSFGIDLTKKVANFSSSTQVLAPFTSADSSGLNSPRRSIGGGSFTNDIFCRSGDVVGCAVNLNTGGLTFFINGDLVAEYHPLSCCESFCNKKLDTEDSSTFLGTSKDQEFDSLVNEVISANRSLQAPGAPLTFRGRSLYPSASLGPQGAQGLAWNFGQRPFKFESALVGQEVMTIFQHSDVKEEDACFEVYDHDEEHWDRVVYRHRVQEITPRLVGWWKLNEGEGTIVDDTSGNGQQGALVINSESIGPKKMSAVAQILHGNENNVGWNEHCSPPAVARRRAGDSNNASPFFPFGSSGDVANKTEPFWGYKFYVIPHFSSDTVGRRRFQSPSLRLSDCPRNVLPRHDQQLIKFINKKGQSKGLGVTQLLHGSWSDIAPQENELVRWPALMEIITSAGDSLNRERADSKSTESSPEFDSFVLAKDPHGRLSKRFKALQEFNAAIHRLLPFVAFHPPSLDDPESSTLDKQFLLSRLVMQQRHRILSVVKRTVWDNALGRTSEPGVSFELTLSRPKAMRFRTTGKTDTEGRLTLFSQAFRQLQSLDGAHFRREDALYHVTFLGENAQDAGGPYRETFAQYCEELQSTQLPLMLPTPNSQHNVGVGREKWLLSPGAQSSTALQMLEFLGKLMGASIRSKQYLSLNMAPLIWKNLAGEQLSLDDLAAVDSMLVNSMSKMRTIDRYGVTEVMFEDIVMETFTTLGADNRVVELKPGGASLPVTFSSRCEYADLVEHARLHESDEQVEAIFRGIAKVVPAKLLACFSGAELELMVCGSPEVDVDLLEKCTEYSSCSPTDDHIIWFWRAMRDFSHEERSAFLRFVWGRSRLPASADEFPQRFKLQSFNQQRAGRSVDAYMPVAHTCFFSIEIPAYSSEAVLREKLLYAIYNCQEIDGDGDSVAANQLGWEE